MQTTGIEDLTMNTDIQNKLFSIISDRFDAYGEINLINDDITTSYLCPDIESKLNGIRSAERFFDTYVKNFVSFEGDINSGFVPNYGMIKSKLSTYSKGFQFPYMVKKNNETQWYKLTVATIQDADSKAYFMLENISGEMDMLQTVECRDSHNSDERCYIYMLDTDNWKMILLSKKDNVEHSIMEKLDFSAFSRILSRSLNELDNTSYGEDEVKQYICNDLDKNTTIMKFISINENGHFVPYRFELRRISSCISNCMSLLKISEIDQDSYIIEEQNLIMQRTKAAVRSYYSIMATINLTANTFDLIYADEAHVKLKDYIKSYDKMFSFISEIVKPEQREDFENKFNRNELINKAKAGEKEESIELLIRFPGMEYKWFEIKAFFVSHKFPDDIIVDFYFGIVDEKVRVEQEKNSYFVGLDSIYDECLMMDLESKRMYIYKSRLMTNESDIVDVTTDVLRRIIHKNIYSQDVYEYTKFLTRNCLNTSTLKDGDRFSCNCRRLMPNGTVQWYKNIITVYSDNHGMGLKILLCWRNINNEMLQKDDKDRIRSKFIAAARSFFEIYEIETGTDRLLRYEITREDKLNIVDTGITWDRLDQLIKDKYIHPSQKEWFSLVLSRSNIMKSLEDENRETHTTMLLKSGDDDEYKWRTIHWRRFKLDNGSYGIMMLVQDVNEYVKEREEQIQQIKESRRIAEQASKAKTRFLSNMTHNMKTPINAISGLTDIISQNAYNTALVSYNARRIGQSSRALNQMIDDVLDMSRIESGTLGLVNEEFSMSDTMMKALEKAYVMTVDKKQTLNLTIGRYQHDRLIGDERRVLQIFDSLLSNAIKFTPEEGSISVKIDETHKAVDGFVCYQIVFEDTGIGMSRRFMKKLFQPFEQEKNNYAGNTEGNGLELAIVKSLLDLMDSEISVKSSLGEGTRMTLLLNLQPVSDKPENINPKELFATEYLNVSVIARLNAEQEYGTNFTGYKVLLVDDNEVNNYVLKTFVEQTGATAIQARNGREAYEIIRDSEPYEYHMIFMDVMMPVMNGFESAEAIRGLRRADTATIPIIAVSANSSAEDILLSLNSGMNKHISKPVECATIYRIMNEFLSSRR